MIWDFVQVFSNVRSKQHFYADDSFDKLNRTLTVIILFISALLIAGRQLVGPAIVCLDDPLRTYPMTINYIESVCWAKNTYRVANITDNVENGRNDITYYQWLTFILAFLALCYYIPFLIWKTLVKSNFASSNNIPIDICGVIGMLKDIKLYKLKDFNGAIKDAVDYLNNSFLHNSYEYREALKSGVVDYDDVNGRVTLIKLNDNFQKLTTIANKNNKILRKSSRNSVCCCARKIYSCYSSCLFVKYLLVKLIYILVSIMVLRFMNLFLNFEDDFAFYGFDMFKKFLNSSDLAHAELWKSKHFPRVVFCELQVRVDTQNVQKAKFQCSLPLNVFNEKVFSFLWFWFLLIVILNIISFFKWIYILITRRKFISKYISYNVLYSNNNSFTRYETNDTRLINLFIDNYLQYDGYFVLLIIKSNLNDIYFKRLLDALWKTYSISNLDDQDLMPSSPPLITSTIGGITSGKDSNLNSEKNLTSPIVVPQQPSSKVNSNRQNRKFLFNDDNDSESKIKLVNDDKTVNDDSDYFNNETQQQRSNALRAQQNKQQQQQPPQTKSGTYVTYRKEDLV